MTVSQTIPYQIALAYLLLWLLSPPLALAITAVAAYFLLHKPRANNPRDREDRQVFQAFFTLCLLAAAVIWSTGIK
jgi:hypothetical protein